MVLACAVIEHRPTGKILLTKRSPDLEYKPGLWESCGGRMHHSEDLPTAVKREVKEETGLDVDVIKPIQHFHDFRGEQKPENEMIGVVFWVQTDSDQITLSREHTEYQWIEAEEALKIEEPDWIRRDISVFIEERKLKSKQL